MRWLWIDRVISIEPGERLVAVKSVSLAEEHLHDHFAADDHGDALPVMPGSLVVEGIAQSAGILVGHAEGFRDNVILAKLNKVSLERDATPGCTIRYTATITQRSPMGASATVTAEILDHGDADRGYVPLGEADLVFSHLPNSSDEIPEHNFVFGEQFRTLLRTSGVTWDQPA
ncbi:MAG: beta-hydroxyacyl-ACP dehydratase [Planctomycetota bacterium]